VILFATNNVQPIQYFSGRNRCNAGERLGCDTNRRTSAGHMTVICQTYGGQVISADPAHSHTDPAFSGANLANEASASPIKETLTITNRSDTGS